MTSLEELFSVYPSQWRPEKRVLLSPWVDPRANRESLKLLESIDSSSKLLWLMSSGSSQKPCEQRWIGIELEAIAYGAEAANSWLEVEPSDRWLCPLPPFHIATVAMAMRARLASNHFTFCWSPKRWNPLFFIEALSQDKATLSSLVPTQVYDLVEQGLSPPSDLRAVLVGGGALQETLYTKARALGWPLLPSYGMTEACSQIATATLRSLAEEQATSPSLKLLPHWERKIDEQGQLWLKGRALFHCYGVIKGGEIDCLDPKQEGWFASGDRVEAVGSQLIPLGRLAELIKVNGELVDLSALQKLLDHHCQLCGYHGDQALIAIDDLRKGKRLQLLATQSNQELMRALLEFNKELLPFLRLQTDPSIVDEIPRSALGKLLPLMANSCTCNP